MLLAGSCKQPNCHSDVQAGQLYPNMIMLDPAMQGSYRNINIYSSCILIRGGGGGRRGVLVRRNVLVVMPI